MPGKLLFDTNAAIAWQVVDSRIYTRYLGRDVAVSIVTVGELRFGASKSTHKAKNHSSVDEFLHFAEVENIGHSTAVRYGELKAVLRAAGKPIPDNDLWIAATAIERRLVLVTRDKHFQLIPGLTVETW